METVTLKYNGGVTTKDYSVLSVRGMDDGDEIQTHNPFLNTSDDGTLYENMDSFRRAITIDFGVVSAAADRLFLFNWATAKDKTITFGSITNLQVVLEDVTRFMNTWLGGSKDAKSYPLRVRERTSWTVVPW